jgi:ABC-type glycerol-3-phosphate transport system substrate-binding protein
MKKVTFILALGVALTLTACGSGSAATETTDSIVDSTSVGVTDSTTAQIPTVEAGASKEDAEKPVSNQDVK